jgi:membrane protein YqaA with SNARE-associated domain
MRALLFGTMHELLIDNGYPALFVLSFMASTLIPLGSEWLLATLILQGFAPLPVVLVASFGNLLGGCTSYGIGSCGSTFLISRILRMDENERFRAERIFARYGSWSLLFSWLPIIGDPLCVIAGLLKVNFSRFALLVLIGKAARYVAVAWATAAGLKSLY